MKPSVFSLEMPLLAKELYELATRRRTFVIRFVYAVLLFSGACFVFYGGSWSGGEVSVLGRGRRMFEQLVHLQFWGIYLFLPAMASGVLTSEKERNSLGLLLLTAMNPWEIVLQKLLSRLIPMVSFLLLSLPLMAVAYSFGGVTQDHLWSGIVLLVLTCLLVGALSVFCSAYFRTTTEAFVFTYLLYLVLCSCCCPVGFAPDLFARAANVGFHETLHSAIPMMLSIVVLIVAARVAVTARAFIPPRNLTLQAFQAMDSFFNHANAITGGVILVKDGKRLPEDKPVAWRETTKRALGTFRYQFRVLVVLQLPILAALLGSRGGNTTPLRTLLYLLWGIAAAMIAVHAAGVVPTERTRQTLDVLLTTPLSSADLICQKLRGVWRLIGVLLVPFLTIVFAEASIKDYRNKGYLVLSLLCIGIYLPLTAWLSMWIGLKIRSQMRAILTAFLLIAGCVIGPILARMAFVDWAGRNLPTGLQYALLASPAAVVQAIETGRPAECSIPNPPWDFYFLHFSLFGGLLYYFRHRCLRDADDLLGRIPEPRSPDQPVT